jgi:hypothetical protein
MAQSLSCCPILAWQTRRNGNLDWRLLPTSVYLVSLVVALYEDVGSKGIRYAPKIANASSLSPSQKTR